MISSKRSGLSCLLSVILLACILFVGCGDDDGAKPRVITLADFAGSWEASSYKLTNAAVPQISIDIISLGATFSWDADNDGSFTGETFIPAALAGQDLTLQFDGAFELVSQDSIHVTFIPEVDPFLTESRAEFTLEGNTLTLKDSNTPFDFDQDGNDEVAIFEGIMVRN